LAFLEEIGMVIDEIIKHFFFRKGNKGIEEFMQQ
jgi:hypothetical protein